MDAHISNIKQLTEEMARVEIVSSDLKDRLYKALVACNTLAENMILDKVEITDEFKAARGQLLNLHQNIHHKDARAKELIRQGVLKEPTPAPATREEFLALPTNMTLAEQWKALERHKNTPMTYSEMRDRFG